MKGRDTFIGPAHINAAVKQSEVLLKIKQSLDACYFIAVSLKYLNKCSQFLTTKLESKKREKESHTCEFS